VVFAQPWWLLLLLLVPVLILQYRRAANRRHVTLQVSRMSALRKGRTWVVYARRWLQALRWVALTLLILAMARPQQQWKETRIETEAIDIVLAVDVSASMLSKDFAPDRLTVAKEVLSDFVSRRPHDRIGLVLFSGGAFTQCPLTQDRRILQAFIQNMHTGDLPDGTSIGMGLATAIDRLKDSPAVGKVVILVTDGEDNTGDLGPLQAAAMAKSLDVKVYTIGIGKDGTVLSPSYRSANGVYYFAPRNMQFDASMLEKMAGMTDGRFFRATTATDLTAIYPEIDRLETSKTTQKALVRTYDLFFYLLNAALCFLILDQLLRWGPLRVITV
jgi:Ca-activated chloride channel family protein